MTDVLRQPGLPDRQSILALVGLAELCVGQAGKIQLNSKVSTQILSFFTSDAMLQNKSDRDMKIMLQNK